MSRQRYSLDVDDLLQETLFTSANSDNLLRGVSQNATTFLAVRAGGTGNGTFTDKQLLAYDAAQNKIISAGFATDGKIPVVSVSAPSDTTLIWLRIDTTGYLVNFYRFVSGAWRPMTAGIPVGTLVPTVCTTVPYSWLLCDGATYNLVDYPDLAAVLDPFWISGATFVLPDTRGRAVVGSGTGSGLTARTRGQQVGVESINIDADSIPHYHGFGAKNTLWTGPNNDFTLIHRDWTVPGTHPAINAGSYQGDDSTDSGHFFIGPSGGVPYTPGSSRGLSTTNQINTGSPLGVSVVQPSLVLPMMIKAK